MSKDSFFSKLLWKELIILFKNFCDRLHGKYRSLCGFDFMTKIRGFLEYFEGLPDMKRGSYMTMANRLILIHLSISVNPVSF